MKYYRLSKDQLVSLLEDREVLEQLSWTISRPISCYVDVDEACKLVAQRGDISDYEEIE